MLQSAAGATVGNIPKSRNEISVHVVCVFADDSSHTSIKVSSVGIREGNFCLSLSLSFFFLRFNTAEVQASGKFA